METASRLRGSDVGRRAGVEPAYLARMTPRDLLPLVLICSACAAGCATKATTEAERSSSASATSAASARVAISATSAAAASASSASPSPSTLPRMRPPPKTLTAGQRTELGTTGLTIASPFANEFDASGTGWSIRGSAPASPSFYALRKEFEPGNPLGATSCKDPKAANGKREADGSYVVKCADNSTNDTWFVRTLPIDDEGYHSLQCMGSSSKPDRLALVESSCRSIKKGP